MPVTTADPNIPSKRVTAEYCSAHFKQTPRNVSMLTRDFISDSLYNPAYGYFSKQALIFSPKRAYDFGSFRDSADLLGTVGRQYEEMERELDDVRNIPRQLWHTPTELLKPWYGRSVARHIVWQHKADCAARHSDDPLVIYEMGGGNGTLMADILGYVRDEEPAIYARVQYNLIEISAKLARKQLGRQFEGVRIVNKSILEWNERVDEPCFFVAMEVIDNFAHDVVRYNYETGEPVQAFVRVYDDGELEELYEPVADPLIKDYLSARAALPGTTYRSPALPPALYRRLRQQLPLAPNLTRREFIPTQTFQLCRVLRDWFPRHRLVLSDFYQLPDTVPDAVDAPVVQTRFDGSMVPCETYLVQPGWFDIFFPTNFELLKRVYDATCRRDAAGAGDRRESRVCTQREFAQDNAELERTRTRSGENPMLEFYENNKFLLS
ncbi:S-adenosyl-L-methionine-dependent methyltransferase [Kickxella alabastrina]|uniref:S-adenosyl-L-methionine-dependent methyltransferase n=1 Tax=Kickxella alabastrina TaxID=61397 RepID=UPI002220C6D0|nr:S-adenosyl-L-methionine-dependent methyltransferase [Kickxella alabastrina]KAI7829968.1 S-adenosyl-L-methionine-dependent methyltransferase [Kickxella alabastrina]